MLNMALYHEEVQRALKQYPDWRVGQAYLNVLFDLDADLARRATGSPIDPFHQDDKLPEFFLWLHKEAAWASPGIA